MEIIHVNRVNAEQNVRLARMAWSHTGFTSPHRFPLSSKAGIAPEVAKATFPGGMDSKRAGRKYSGHILHIML